MILNSRSVFLVAVSFVTPVAATSYINAQATATYVQPIANVSYIDARVQAEVTFPGVDTYTQNATDSIAFLDVKVVDITLGKIDDVTLGSSGNILIQDYAGADYFAEDYVGSSTSFT
ncbi:hypothetical protein UFOVP285_11 [uncultured Caudovirales phage]|uniref:Uncharacterized protein n=1 Tax=uncultured Caudovirales phage TaxID=2100421 RepID=A0A6J5LUI2_9CAUD|nr:hypothetical protein UFOVP285_11 [uncultured Caudovirales phage]